MLVRPILGDGSLYVGFFLLGFGGPGVQMATFHMAQLFPRHSGSLIAANTALFDAGTAIFACFFELTSKTAVSLTACWVAYAAAVLFVLASGAM
eukprot:2696746-Prymnesium_polylepis.1